MKITIKILKTLGIIILLIFGYMLLSLSPLFMINNKTMSKNQHIIVGHRGAGGLAPENTLAAIKVGLDNKVDRIEIDVHQSKDGRIVVMHDETLDRTTNGKGLIKDKTWDEISKLDAGYKFSPDFKDVPVPLLEDVIKFIDGRADLIIEIKGGSEYYAGIEQNVVDIIRENNAMDWCLVHSFYTGILEKLHQIAPELVLHKLFVVKFPFLPILLVDRGLEYYNFRKHTYISEYSLFYRFANRRIIWKLHKSGKRVNVWTVDDPKNANKLLKLGVDGIITNYPDKIK
jgi:glycerophosphoryl diester phosphodiesterase